MTIIFDQKPIDERRASWSSGVLANSGFVKGWATDEHGNRRRFEAQVFGVPSPYGFGGGTVSRLFIIKQGMENVTDIAYSKRLDYIYEREVTRDEMDDNGAFAAHLVGTLEKDLNDLQSSWEGRRKTATKHIVSATS
jgi:hypothetical protein